MGFLTLNPETVDQLRNAKELTVLRDDAGNPLGFFSPVPTSPKTNITKTYTTQEVFEMLLSLTTDEEMRSHLKKIIEEVKERNAA